MTQRRFGQRPPLHGDRTFELLRKGLTWHQALEAMHLHASRRKAQAEAQRTLEIIEQGSVSGKLQKAALGTLKDAESYGMLDPDAGPFLGFLDGHALHYPGDKHIATMGLSGSGKGTTVALPNIIHGAGRDSLVALDLKDAELSWCTANARAELDGVEPAFINPWGLHDRPSVRINPLQDLIDVAQAGRRIVDLAVAKTRMIFSDPDRQGQNAWIQKDAMRIARTVMIERAYHDPERCNPASLWDFANGTHDEFRQFFELTQKSPAAEGHVATLSRKLLDQYGDDISDQFNWVMDNMADAFGLYGKGSELRDAVQTTDFDLRLLKQRPQAVYIMIPDTFALSHGKWVALMLDYVFETIASAQGPIRTTVLADEFANFPRVDTAIKTLRLYREKGLRLWTFVQDRGGFRAYQEEGGHKPFEENSIQLLWGVTDAAHAKDIETLAGYTAVSVAGLNTSAGITAPGAGLTASEQVTPVLPVSEIAQIADGRAILLIPGKKVFVVERKPWWELECMRRWIRDKRTETPSQDDS